uniref:NADH-ubiquinone oxidoreductase chain 4 n=1 Tax=Lycocerus asperipennis TaxID=2806094 RepID=A0A7U1BEC8_9COLE|nr:NADH dehydrogenase subunit 4 [Lycocerus asperipennis]QQY97882.1 NADH dehydrogenase subunit 4 [Lycocerus asperipennis]
MKFLMFMLFLIPLSFKKKMEWMISLLFFILFFMFMLTFSFSKSYYYISMFMGCDYISYFFILLTLWILGLMILASEKIITMNFYSNLFILMLLMLMISLFLVFSSMNLLIFYIFFEISVIPTLILILGWGYQPERIQAGIYMFFYMLLTSLPMMVSIFYLYFKFNSLDFFKMTFLNSYLLFFCLTMIFMVKIPMYFVHLWLPKAHVEAPVSGSMILAGIMLKLGGYGLIRLMKIFIFIINDLSIIFISLSLIGSLIVSFICLVQSDMKALIAYSSVSHMGLVLAGIFSFSLWGVTGAFIMMLAHGLCSSGLFCLSNMSYERLGTRSLFLSKGLINYMPNLTFWWFLLCSSNMAAPPSLNLLGEIMIINSMISWNLNLIIIIMLTSFFSASYSLYLYSFSQHGKASNMIYYFYSGYIREYLMLLLHWLPLNLLVFFSDLMV